MPLRRYGSCVNFSGYLAFVAFLLLVPPAVITLGRPLFRPCLHHFRQVWSFARSPSGEIKRRWFDWSWSWLFGIGPIGREGVGIVWGYWKWEGEVETLGRGWLAVMLGVGTMLSVIAIVSPLPTRPSFSMLISFRSFWLATRSSLSSSLKTLSNRASFEPTTESTLV